MKKFKKVFGNLFAGTIYDKGTGVRAVDAPSGRDGQRRNMSQLQGLVYEKGDFIGRKYEVYDVLGVGGFGIVYLVYSHETGSVYALKTSFSL